MYETLCKFSAFCIVTPFLALGFGLLYVYRCFVEVILRIQLKDRYVGLLKGTDSVWAIEETSALSIINILVVLEKDARHSNIGFLENFRNLVKERLLNSTLEKLLYRRRKKFGYYFWERCDDVDLEERVRWLEHERANCEGACGDLYGSNMKSTLQEICNKPLPHGHSTSWEILVGRTCHRSSHHNLRRIEERAKSGKIKIPILFRVHHSLGDGIALLRLLLEVVADKDVVSKSLVELGDDKLQRQSGEEDCDIISIPVPQRNSAGLRSTMKHRAGMYSYESSVLSASMPFANVMLFVEFGRILQNFIDTKLKLLHCLTTSTIKREVIRFFTDEWNNLRNFLINDAYTFVKKLIKTTRIVYDAPECLYQQAVRSMDNSTLHGPELTGEKIISYWLEDDSKKTRDERMLLKIQTIKYITGARFEDVFLAALSSSLHKYFLQVDIIPPDRLTVVLPYRMEMSKDTLTLENNFSVGLLPLCISEINEQICYDPMKDPKILERLQDVTVANDKLRSGLDYTINFWVMKYLSAILPDVLLRPLLESHSTMVFSNLVGPKEVHILGHSLKNIAFWIPSRSTTGIGCSLLSYRGYLHLSLAADKALVQNEKLLAKILENTVHEIDDLYDRLTASSFAKKFHTVPATSTEKEIGVL
ncbi:hypothetical protein KM043_011102 [Ampulex compressa]|nr:hypothetical protein KM043_011102 [Ampulex compressa]